MKKQEPRRIFSRQRAKQVAAELTQAQLEKVSGGMRNGTVSFCECGHDDCDEI